MSHRKIGPFNPGVGEKINGEWPNPRWRA
jgi:hypothetical protein